MTAAAAGLLRTNNCPWIVQEVEGYDIPGLGGVRTVLDVGAHCGAFAVWAQTRWPGCSVTCYEPWPANYKALAANLGAAPWATLSPTAVVGRPTPTVTLYPGDNTACVSEFDIGRRGIGPCAVVPAVRAQDLPRCDFLKVDTEGAEPEILAEYLPMHQPAAVVYEWHTAADRTALYDTLAKAGYTCLSDEPWRGTVGTAKWLRSELL